MGAFVSYNLMVAIFIVALWGVFRGLLSSQKLIAFNRIVLLAGIAMCFAAPLLMDVFVTKESAVGAVDIEVGMPVVSVGHENSAPPLWPWIVCACYFTGLAVSVILAVVQYVRLRMIMTRGNKTLLDDGVSLVTLNDNARVSPFSWMNTIVMTEGQYHQAPEMILAHERAHIARRHSLDMIMMQVVCALQWFNPAAWALRDELRTVHEYQADADVLGRDIDAREYQYLLIKMAVGTRFPALANSLNHSNLKKRITMMQKSKGKCRRLLGLALVPAMALAIGAVSIPAVASTLTAVSNVAPKHDDKNTKNPTSGQMKVISTTTIDKKTGKVVENPAMGLPEFPGGTAELMNFLSMNVRYPQSAMDKGIEGKVVVSFTVKDDGRIVDAKVIRSVDPDLDAEALRVIGLMPKWNPAVVDGKAQSATYALPVSFKLTGKSDKKDVRKEEKSSIVILNGKAFYGDINSINPSTIDSMKVVKTAEVPQGVIMIYTK